MAFDARRLYVALNNTGLQNKDNALYQVLYQLINALKGTQDEVGGIIDSGGGGSTVENITQIFQQFGLDSGGDAGDGDSLPIPGPVGPVGSQGLLGPMGAIIFPPDAEDGDVFPPQVGIQGNPGPTGAQGPQGIPGMSPEEGPEGDVFPIPGPQGPSGNQGLTGVGVPGPALYVEDGLEGEPGLFIIATAPVPPAIYSYVYRNTAQTITDSAQTPILFSDAAADNNEFWDVGLPTRLTVPTGLEGTYVILGQVSWAIFGATGNVSVTLFKNGTQIAEVLVNVTGIVPAIQVSVQENLIATDYIELKVTPISTSGTYNTVGGARSTFLQLVRATAVSGGVGEGDSGALVLLDTKTASGSTSLDFTSIITSTYDVYAFEFQNIVPATDGATLCLRVSTNNGSSYDSANNYRYAFRFTGSNASTGVVNSNSAGLIGFCGSLDSTSADGGGNGLLKLYNPLSASQFKMITHESGFRSNDGNFYQANGSGGYAVITAVDAVRFLMSAGNITSGIIRAYGIKNS